MKKWGFFLAILVAIGLFGGRNTPGTDISRLEPAQTVRIGQFNGYVTVETDTGAWGMGGDLDAAIKNMNDTANGQVFLETAEFLVVCAEMTHLIPTAADYLRPSCGLCVEAGQTDMVQVGRFLQNHDPAVTLQDYLAGLTDLPTLLTTQEGMLLVH